MKVKGYKDRGDVFASPPPLESKRILLSRTASKRNAGRVKKRLFIDAQRAHLHLECDEEVFIGLPEEGKVGKAKCGKVNFWLYGFGPEAQAVENLYETKFIEPKLVRGIGSY